MKAGAEKGNKTRSLLQQAVKVTTATSTERAASVKANGGGAIYDDIAVRLFETHKRQLGGKEATRLINKLRRPAQVERYKANNKGSLKGFHPTSSGVRDETKQRILKLVLHSLLVAQACADNVDKPTIDSTT